MTAQNANYAQAGFEMYTSPFKIHWMQTHLIKTLLVAKETEGPLPC